MNSAIRCAPVFAILAAAAFGQSAPAKGAAAPKRLPTVKHIDIEPDGSVLITLSDGNKVHEPLEHRPESDVLGGTGACADPAITDDGSAAGWFVEFRWPGVTYTVPQVLVVYRPGKPLRRIGPRDLDYRILTGWVFVKRGRQVAFCRKPLHGPGDPLYELHDVESGRLLATWSGVLGGNSPGWANLFQDR